MSTTSATLETTQEFTIRLELAPPVEVGAGALGTRIVFGIVGGRIDGDRVKADVQPGGADYLLVGSDGFGQIEVHGIAKTDDGANIYVKYTGLIQMNGAIGNALATGGGTEFEDQYFRTFLRLESGDERYAWVNQSLFVGEGRLVSGGLEYRVHRIG